MSKIRLKYDIQTFGKQECKQNNRLSFGTINCVHMDVVRTLHGTMPVDVKEYLDKLEVIVKIFGK